MDESSEESQQQQQQQQEDVTGADQISKHSNGDCTFPYPPDHAPAVVATSSRGLPRSLPSFTPGASTSKHQLAGMGMDPKQQRIDLFWADQMLEAEKADDFKNHTLPLARIKKIMKADEDVKMISMEAPVVFAKACEMFISELTMRAWMHTEESKRKTLQKNDIAAAISRNDTFDFLVDILPRDDDDQVKEETHASSTEPIPYYYLPQQHQAGPSGTTVYGDYQQHHLHLQLPQSMGFMPWPDQLQEQHHEHNEGDENENNERD